jgi:hypothetical protein
MWIVQLAESYEFLCPSADGDVTSTPWLRSAGVFDSVEAASDTADFYIGQGQYEIVNVFCIKLTYH